MLILCPDNLSSMNLVYKENTGQKHPLQSQNKLNPNDRLHESNESFSHVIQHVPTHQCCHLLHKTPVHLFNCQTLY